MTQFELPDPAMPEAKPSLGILNYVNQKILLLD